MRVLLTLSLAVLPLAAQSDLAPRLDQIASAELARQHVPGMAVAAIRDGRVVYSKGFGAASVEAPAPVTPATLFRAGQATKLFVAAALVELAEQGRLRLDAPVGNYIVGLSTRIAALTAHQIFSQTTGLKDESPNSGPHDDAALAREVASWKDSAIFMEPGKIFSTSNLGFALGGRLLESIKGEPFADAMDELLFRPLGMAHTTFRPTVAMTYPLAVGHSADGKVIRPAPDNSAYWPAFSLYSCAADLGRFLEIFLNGGKLGDAQLFSPSLIETLAAPRVPRLGLPGTSYGYGLIVDSTRNTRLLRQAIAVPGYDGAIVMSPEFKAAVVLLVNQSGGDAAGLADRILDRVSPVGLGPPPAPAPSAGGDLSRYAGKYANGAAIVEIAAKDPALTVKTTGAPVAVEPAGGECFRGGSTSVCFSEGFAHLGVRAYKKQ